MARGGKTYQVKRHTRDSKKKGSSKRPVKSYTRRPPSKKGTHRKRKPSS